MTDDDKPRCILCPVLRPSEKPRNPIRMPCCEGCRIRLRRDLDELPDSYAQLDLVPGRASAEGHSRAFGSKLPANVSALNLVGPGSWYLSEIGWTEAQIGDIPPLLLLDQWVADWILVRDMHEPQPEPYVITLCAWLGTRLDWACDHHPAVDEFASQVTHIASTVRSIAGLSGDKRGEYVGRCPRAVSEDKTCGAKLYVDPYADVIRCGRCGFEWHRRKGEWLRLRGEQLAVRGATA